MNKKHLIFVVLVATFVTPATVFASDFTILVVGLGAFMIAALLIILGIIGTSASRSKGL